MKKFLAAYFDVDRLFLRSLEGKPRPIPAVVERIRNLHAKGGFNLYLSSSNGAAYARAVAIELGIADCFAAFLDRPTDGLPDDHNDEW